jgi:hypothetical protein
MRREMKDFGQLGILGNECVALQRIFEAQGFSFGAPSFSQEEGRPHLADAHLSTSTFSKSRAVCVTVGVRIVGEGMVRSSFVGEVSICDLNRPSQNRITFTETADGWEATICRQEGAPEWFSMLIEILKRIFGKVEERCPIDDINIALGVMARAINRQESSE